MACFAGSGIEQNLADWRHCVSSCDVSKEEPLECHLSGAFLALESLAYVVHLFPFKLDQHVQRRISLIQ